MQKSLQTNDFYDTDSCKNLAAKKERMPSGILFVRLFYQLGDLLKHWRAGDHCELEQNGLGAGDKSAFSHGALNAGFLVADFSGSDTVLHQIDVVSLGQKVNDTLQDADVCFGAADNNVFLAQCCKSRPDFLTTHYAECHLVIGPICLLQAFLQFFYGRSQALGVLFRDDHGDAQNL